MSLDLLLRREPSANGRTFGTLFVGGARQCDTLEDVVREVPGQPVAMWKVKGQTAIPAGRYRVTLQDSPKFGPDTLTITAVPGFDYIRIHAGNTAAHTDGCPLVGSGRAGDTLTGSKVALAALKSRVLPAFRAGQEVWITIDNPVGGAT
ncbi:MAG: hypothetical protein IT352_07505 [Gemmatimonadales bacterium]|nr:hypothetical protein [Gemmatimonadales bacterium]